LIKTLTFASRLYQNSHLLVLLIYAGITYWVTDPGFKADVAKLADALDLGSSAARHVGSTPIIRTDGVDKLSR